MKIKTLVLFASFLCCSIANSAVVYQFSTGDATFVPDDGYDPAEVTAMVGSGVSAPANGTALATGNVMLNRFWNSEWAGFTLTAGNGTSLDNATEFGQGYFTFTVTAVGSNTIDLTNLTFGSAQGGSSDVRGFELYAAVDGGAFTFGDTPVLDVNMETGTRTNPQTRVADLTGATYQGINSVTFRYYALTTSTGQSIDFNGMTLNGEVIPEPSAICLFGIGALALTVRRRR